MITKKIAIVGLGYVGLPLAVEFSKKFDVVGFDIDKKRISQLLSGYDKTQEIEHSFLKKNQKLNFSFQLEEIKDCSIFIITVPTPVNQYKVPDLGPLLSASEMIGSLLK